MEIHIKICKEEQIQDSVLDGESDEIKKEQVDSIGCELDLSAQSKDVPKEDIVPSSHVSPNAKKEVLVVTDQPTPCPELVRGRKPGFIFTEVWDIPVMEIGSEGAFTSHCGKALLLDVLDSIQDMSTMANISGQLRSREELKSLQEVDIQEIVAEASTFLNTALMAIRKKINFGEERKNPVVCLEVYKLHQKLAKVWPGKEKDAFIFLKAMYAVINNNVAGIDKMTESGVLSFWSAKLAAQAGQDVGPTVIDGCASNGKTNMRDFEEDNITENISRINKLKHREQKFGHNDAKDINDNYKSNDIFVKKNDNVDKVNVMKRSSDCLNSINAQTAEKERKER